MRDFSELSEREVLALAIGAEEEDGRIYNDLVERMREEYPATAKIFSEMAGEESEHRHKLLELYREKFGEHIPLVRRQDVRGFLTRKAIWQMPKPSIEDVRKLAESMETETQRFYRLAASRATDVSIRKLLGDLAEVEQEHEQRVDELSAENLTPKARRSEDAAAKQSFLLQYIQPGLVGLMDGSVSTLAPIFAAAFAFPQSGRYLDQSQGNRRSRGRARQYSKNGDSSCWDVGSIERCTRATDEGEPRARGCR